MRFNPIAPQVQAAKSGKAALDLTEQTQGWAEIEKFYRKPANKSQAVAGVLYLFLPDSPPVPQERVRKGIENPCRLFRGRMTRAHSNLPITSQFSFSWGQAADPEDSKIFRSVLQIDLEATKKLRASKVTES